MSFTGSKSDAPSNQWPGERTPTRWDVHDANENPATTFLDRFHAALLHSEGIVEDDCELDSDLVIESPETLQTPVSPINCAVFRVCSTLTQADLGD